MRSQLDKYYAHLRILSDIQIDISKLFFNFSAPHTHSIGHVEMFLLSKYK